MGQDVVISVAVGRDIFSMVEEFSVTKTVMLYNRHSGLPEHEEEKEVYLRLNDGTEILESEIDKYFRNLGMKILGTNFVGYEIDSTSERYYNTQVISIPKIDKELFDTLSKSFYEIFREYPELKIVVHPSY